MKTVLFCLLVFFSGIHAEMLAQSRGITFKDTFKSKNYRKNWEKAEVCCPHSMKALDSVESGTGRNAIRFEVDITDPKVNNGFRSELRLPKEPESQVERWYSFGIFLPKGYAVDSSHEILAQWHETPDFALGEKYRTPPIDLQIDKADWKVYVSSAKSEVNTDRTIDLKKVFELGQFEDNQWTDWVFHIKFSYQEDGILEVWKNGKKVVSYNGPNSYNDKKGPFFKVGIYKVPWKFYKNNSVLTNRVVYFSEVKVGNENTNYQEMTKK